jgi:hypothetical protein
MVMWLSPKVALPECEASPECNRQLLFFIFWGKLSTWLYNMYSEQKDSDKDQEVEALRAENCLIFTRPSNVALIDARTMKSYNFANPIYPDMSSTFQIIVNSGGDAIYGRSSYLRLEYQVGSAGVDFGLGTILNIFSRIRISHRSGEILEDVLNVNLLANLKRFWAYSRTDRMKLDGDLGVEATAANSNVPIVSTTQVAIIPMSLLCGLFDNEHQMIPPALLSGCRIELEMSPYAQITTINRSVGSGPTTIFNFRPTLVLDSCQLYDVVNKQLLEEMADEGRSGIQFSFKTVFNSFVTSGQTSVNIDVQQSASCVTKAIAVCRDIFQINNIPTVATDIGGDAFKAIAPFAQAQWRLGSQYFPQQVCSVPKRTTVNNHWNNTQAGSKEWYQLTHQAWMSGFDQFHKSAGLDASVQFNIPDFAAELSTNSWAQGQAHYGYVGERSPVGLELTGQSSNNSRVLNFNATIADLTGAAAQPAAGAAAVSNLYYTLTSAVGYRVDIFLEYLRVANVLGDSCIIDR